MKRLTFKPQNNTKRRRLVLSRETLRVLCEQDLTRAAGGTSEEPEPETGDACSVVLDNGSG